VKQKFSETFARSSRK